MGKTRTETLREKGARQRSSGDRAPFVNWPDEYAFIEGVVTDLWEGKYGKVARMRVAAVSDGLLAVDGEGEDRKEFAINFDDVVNVGLSYASLRETIEEQDQGSAFHIAFEGWDTTKGGQKFRLFRVIDLPNEEGDGEEVPF
jgi:hypothetical protein